MAGPLHAPPHEVAAFYPAFGKLAKLIQEPKYTHRHLLGPGECAVFANQRVLHGRESFDPTSGERHLRGTYVVWDEFKDRLRVFVI